MSVLKGNSCYWWAGCKHVISREECVWQHEVLLSVRVSPSTLSVYQVSPSSLQFIFMISLSKFWVSMCVYCFKFSNPSLGVCFGFWRFFVWPKIIFKRIIWCILFKKSIKRYIIWVKKYLLRVIWSLKSV